MAIDSVRLQGLPEPNRQEVVVEVAALDLDSGKLELSIVRGDVLEDRAVIELSDLLAALQALRRRNG